MERRLFLQRTGVIGGAALLAPSLISAKKKTTKLVILHTNDTHSNIDPFPANHPKFPNLGGVSRRAKLIEQVRATENNVLLLDAGDIFQGTPYFNKFKGFLEMKTMEAMKYDVVTLGNHDFDLGMEAYRSAYSHASFRVVNANYELENTALNDIVLPHVILKKGGFKIGVFGLGVDLNSLVAKDNWRGLVYQDPIQAANKQAKVLREKGADLVICLSHLGYDYNSEQVSDRKLAAKTEGIDVIIGGHTHTFLDEIQTVSNAAGKNVYINQVGYGGLKLGRIDIELSHDDAQGLISSTNQFIDNDLNEVV